MTGVQRVDHNAIKFVQITIMAVAVAAWVVNLPWLVAALAVLMAVNVAWPAQGPLRLTYRHVILGLRGIRPNLVEDEAAPHRFSQGLGALFLGGAAAALYLGAPVWGWSLVALVAVLAAVNVFWNFCAGCFLYYQLRRIGLIRRAQTA